MKGDSRASSSVSAESMWWIQSGLRGMGVLGMNYTCIGAITPIEIFLTYDNRMLSDVENGGTR